MNVNLGIVDRRIDGKRRFRQQRRRYPRVSMRLDGFYGSPQRAFLGATRDLSLRGLFLTTAAPDEIGTQADLRLITPGAPTMLRLPVRVCRNNLETGRGPRGMALRFEGLLPWQMKRLAAVLLSSAGWLGLGIDGRPIP